MTAEVCAQKMLNEFISRWGCPLSVHNDQGRTYFTKYVEIIPVPDMPAEICAQKMLNEFISKWGCPLSVHNDQGRTYQDFKQLCRMLIIRKTRTSPRHPQEYGQSERFTRTLLQMVKAYLCGEQRDWDLHLGCLAGAYRATPNESTKLSLNLLTIGRELRVPSELVFSSKNTCDGLEITSYELTNSGRRCNMLMKWPENI